METCTSGTAEGKTRKGLPIPIIEYTIDTPCNSEPQTYRLITSLMDTTLFPALLLATEYHSRWEIENTIDELKVHLNGRKTPIRSQKPREVFKRCMVGCLGIGPCGH